jgi:hypothetical protein
MTDEGIDPSLITQQGIERVLAFLPALSEPNAEHGTGPAVESTDENTFTIIPASLSERASEFVDACYEEKFVQSFDWMEWSDRHQAHLTSDAFIGKADLATIAKLLTTHIRSDRFFDGHLLSVLKDGTVLRILERLDQINSEQDISSISGKPRR